MVMRNPMAKRSNFIIMYSGREGSSAIVSMLSAQNGVHVPLFEDLDPHNTEKTGLYSDLPVVVNDVFQTGELLDADRHRALYPHTYDKGDVIGFKIRLFHPVEDIAPVLVANHVTVFVLSRRNFVELVSSHYFNINRPLTENLASGAFPQFKLSVMDESARRAALAELDAISVKPRFKKFLAIASNVAKSRTRITNYARELARSGVPVVPIYYEDFLADRVRFIARMLADIGFPQDWPVVDTTKFVKVLQSPARKKLRGVAWHLGWIFMQYDRLIYWLAQRRSERL